MAKKRSGRKFEKLVIEEIPAHGDLSDDLKGKTIGALRRMLQKVQA